MGGPLPPMRIHPPTSTDIERITAELAKALNWKGDWNLCPTSHIAEAMEIAALCDDNCDEICGLFVAMGFEGVSMSKSKSYTLDAAYGEGQDESDDSDMPEDEDQTDSEYEFEHSERAAGVSDGEDEDEWETASEGSSGNHDEDDSDSDSDQDSHAYEIDGFRTIHTASPD